MGLTEREMRVPEVEEEVISAEDLEVEEDLEEEVVSEEEVAEDSEEVLVVKAVLDHLGLKKHHKPIFFIHHHQLSLASYFQHQLFQLSQPRNSNYFLLNTKNIDFQFLRSLIDTTQIKVVKKISHVQLTSEVHRNL